MLRLSITIRAATIASLLASTTCTALPNITVQPLEVSCASYPGYDESAGTAGPWTAVVADSTGTDVEGFGLQPVFAFAAGGGSWGFIVIPTTEPVEADHVPLRCADNATIQAQLDDGRGGVGWRGLVAAGTPGEQVLGFGLPPLPDPNLRLEPYAHLAATGGDRLPGVFLGSGNVTSWGFNYQNTTEAGEYYYLRLLGPGQENPATGKPLNEGEFAGFIRIGD